MTAILKLTGVDLGAKKPDLKKADFFIESDVKLDVSKFITGPATTALNDVFKELTAAFAAAEKALKPAQTKVKGLTTKVNAERAKVRKEKAAAEARVQSAEHKQPGTNT